MNGSGVDIDVVSGVVVVVSVFIVFVAVVVVFVGVGGVACIVVSGGRLLFFEVVGIDL